MVKTSRKSNRRKIRSRLHNAIFTALVAEAKADQDGDQETFSRPALSHTADVAGNAIIREERIEVKIVKPQTLSRKESRKWISRALRDQRRQGDVASQGNERD